MKIHYMSDLHLYFGKLKPERFNFDGDVVVVAGDTSEGFAARNWLEQLCANAKAVIYILGNHDYYQNGDKSLLQVIEYWQQLADEIENLYFLENDHVIIDDVLFMGGTMWTDFGKDPYYGAVAEYRMNDYKQIHMQAKPEWLESENGTHMYNDFAWTPKRRNYNQKIEYIRKLRWMDTVEIHDAFVGHMVNIFDKYPDMKKVVVSHHSPLTPVPFKNDDLCHAYSTDMSEFMEQYDIDAWIFGHTHTPVATRVHDTLVVSNPRGYNGHEDIAKDFDPTHYLEIK